MKAGVVAKAASARRVKTNVTDVLVARIKPVETSVLSNSRDLQRATTASTGLRPYTIHPRTAAFAAYCTAAGSPISYRLQMWHTRAMNRMDWLDVWNDLIGIYAYGETEKQWLYNHAGRPEYNLTKVGSPTYSTTAPLGVFAPTVADYYDTNIPPSLFSQNNAGIDLWPTSNYAANAADAGDRVGRMALYTRYATNGSRPIGFLFNSIGATAPGTGRANDAWFYGSLMYSIDRGESGNVVFSHMGVAVETVASASAAPVASPHTLRLLQAADTSPIKSGATLKFATFRNTLPEWKKREFVAIWTEYMDGIQYGMPTIYDIGVGPDVIRRDVIVDGCGPEALHIAHTVRKMGLTVACVGDWADETATDPGGIETNGLNNIDAAIPANVTGLYREGKTWENTVYYGRADTTSQVGLSTEPRSTLAKYRRMCDPTRTTGILPGQDVEIYMTGGITGVGMIGTEMVSVTTRDGRTFYGRDFAWGSADGDLLFYAGIPHITGSDAAGTGVEAVAGYKGAAGAISITSSAGTGSLPLAIDPYIVPGVPTSGMLPYLSSPRGLAIDGPDPALQAMNLRLTVNTTWRRSAPLTETVPNNYDPANYELVGRYFAAWKAATGADIPLASVWQPFQLVGDSRDSNSIGLICFELPGAGERYAAAGTDVVARRGVWNDVINYQRGWIHWICNSGDARIPTAVRDAVASYTLDAAMHLDPGRQGRLYEPKQVYRREPIFKPRNTGAMGSGVAVLDGNDFNMADGTTPRSIKTIATPAYAWDRHGPRLVADGGTVKALGVLNNTIVGNPAGRTDLKTPWPYEVSVPDRGVCTNLVFVTAPSCTAMAWAPTRMQPTTCQAAESMGYAIYLRRKYNCDIQDVPYPELRTMIQSSGYGFPPTLPQTN